VRDYQPGGKAGQQDGYDNTGTNELPMCRNGLPYRIPSFNDHSCLQQVRQKDELFSTRSQTLKGDVLIACGLVVFGMCS
jgi:hypothetical protein